MPRLGEGLALVDGGADLLLDRVDLLGGRQDGLLVRLRNHHDAVGIAAQQVPGMDARVADVDDRVDRLHLHAVLPRAHRVAAAEDRILQLAREVRVAAGAVDHRAGDAPPVSHPGQDVAPHRRVLAAAVVEHDHAPRLDIVDVVADSPGRLAGGPVQNRERTTGHAETRVERLDVQTLAGDAQSIERIADRCRVESGRTIEIVVVRHYFLSIVS